MLIFSFSIIFSFFFTLNAKLFTNFVDVCKKDSALGLDTLDYAVDAILEEAFMRRETLRQEIYQQIQEHNEIVKSRQNDDSTSCPVVTCPTPQPTIFPPYGTTTPTPPPTQPPPATQSQPPSTASATSVQTDAPNPSSSSSSALPPLEEEKAEAPKKQNAKPKPPLPGTWLSGVDPARDPFYLYVTNLKKYLHKNSGACAEPPADFSTGSITWEQLFGFFSQLATVHPGPFCNLCERFADAVEKKILKPNPVLLSKDEQFMRKLINVYLPSPRLLCAAIAPGCTDKLVLAKNATEIKEAELCLECTACYSILNLIFHELLLNEHLMKDLAIWFHENLFYDLCADFCPIGQSASDIFGCFTMEKCQAWADRLLYDIIRAMKVILKPERFCVLELGWCELGEQPNIMHCLRELCEAELGTTAPFGALCALIPDRPPDADAFINVKETKIYKQMKDYHYAYYEKFAEEKTEL